VGRKPNAIKAARRVRDSSQFRESYLELDDAAALLRGQGDVGAVECALDQLAADAQSRSVEDLPANATRSAKAKWLADRYVAASYLASRCRRLLDDVTATTDTLREQLVAVLAVQDEVAGYERDFLTRLSAAGVGQPDLHTGGRKLAEAVAAFIRQYNSDRRDPSGPSRPDDYADVLPLSSWRELPRIFAGVEVVDVEAPKGLDVCPLPPFTDIARYTVSGCRPSLCETRRETLKSWSSVIDSWCAENGRELTPLQKAVWALLLGHYMQPDTSNLANLEGLEVASPWSDDGVVRIKDVTGIKKPWASTPSDNLPSHTGASSDPTGQQPRQQ
jgi:hypothetical protein